MKSGLHVALPELAKTYGPVYTFYFGRYPVIVVSDPDLVKEVRQSRRAASLNGSCPVTGQAQLSSEQLSLNRLRDNAPRCCCCCC